MESTNKYPSRSESATAGKPIRCKAAICRKAGEALVIEEIEVAPPRAWEVRIKILCTSLCHTDITFWKLDIGPASGFPKILGHEAVGVVESVGEYVEEVKEGDIVLPVFFANCEECRDCKSEKSNCCSKFKETKNYHGMPRDGTSRFKDLHGQTIKHFLAVSSFAQFTVVDIAHLVDIGSHIPIDKACLLGCGVSTEGARLRKASKVIGVDLNPNKFEIGKKFGVTHFINPTNCKDKSVTEVIKELTDGGADYCFECIGLASLVQDAFTSCREGWGRTIVLGVEMHGTPISLHSYEILRGKTVTGSLFGGIKPKSDIPLLAQKYIDKELNLDEFISHEVRFHEINEAFDLLLQGKSIRCIIWMD
ncbi:Alcohol dehydrogenase-like, C-terminal [Dillenia turbinata]|uniref:Alcohol dehydrogenase-like, C-terminal n=1 Tax=Dillenia turbinata TaxID=194707 RepID=A0AAN8W1B7_9MAGN